MVEKPEVSSTSQHCSFAREGLFCSRNTFMESCGAIPILMDNIQPGSVEEVIEAAAVNRCPRLEELRALATYCQVNRIETPLL